MNTQIIRWGYANLYRSDLREDARRLGQHIWDKEEEARGVGRLYETYITTVRVQWEEK